MRGISSNSAHKVISNLELCSNRHEHPCLTVGLGQHDFAFLDLTIRYCDGFSRGHRLSTLLLLVCLLFLDAFAKFKRELFYPDFWLRLVNYLLVQAEGCKRPRSRIRLWLSHCRHPDCPCISIRPPVHLGDSVLYDLLMECLVKFRRRHW